MPLIMPIYGTRPEAIKMAPIVAELRRTDAMDCFVAVTGQHRSMLDQVNRLFDIIPDHDLNIFEPGQSLNGILSRTEPRHPPGDLLHAFNRLRTIHSSCP